MLTQALLVDLANDVEAVLDPFIGTCGVDGLAAHRWVDVANKLVHHALSVVNKRIDLPGLSSILSIVTKTDTKTSEDSARLDNGETIFFPNGQGAKR